MKKRLLSFTLAVLMIVCTVVGTLPSINVIAAGTISIVAEVEGKDSLNDLVIGDVVTVKVVVPEITNTRKFQIDLNYDNSKFEYNDDANAAPIISALTIGDVKPVDNSIIRLVAAGMANASFSAGTVALTASFTVKSGEGAGTFDAFSLSNFICGDGSVSIDTTPVKATVREKKDPVITVSNATVEQGQSVSVTLNLSDNEGVAGMSINIGYDSALTVTNIVKGSALSSLNFAGGVQPYSNPLVLLWVGLYDDVSNGDLVTITFSVPENAEVGEYPITVTYDPEEVFDADLNDVNLVINNGCIEVTGKHVCSFGDWEKYDELYHIHSCACGETEKAAHNWNAGVITTEPDCITGGEKTYTCTDCGATKTEAVDSLGHSYDDWKETTAATCTAGGAERRDCTRCDHYETRATEKLGHAIVSHDAKAATCTEIGWEAYETCSRCDYTTYAEIPALGHSYDDWKETIAATCTAGGAERRDCTRCDHYETRATEKLGHAIVNHDAKAATCTEIGWNAYETCSRCDYTTYTEIPVLGHSYDDWKETTAATCTAGGAERRDCTRCDHYETRATEKLGHAIVNHDAKTATCTEIGWKAYETCSRCDYTTYVEIPALGHDIVHHDAKAPTFTEIGWEAYETCSRCDYTTYVEIPALEHDIVHHDAKAPTCTEIGWEAYVTCSRCDYTTYVEIPALGHSYDAWKETTAATCIAGGAERRDCTRCDHYETRATEKLGHAIVNHDAKAATCTEIGWKAYETCSRCDYTTYVEIPALGHNYSSVITPPTTTSEGYTTHTCERCGDSYVDSYVDKIPVENAPTITVSNVTGRAGETVTVTVDMKNNPGFGGMAFDVKYDNAVLELVSYELGLGGAICTPSGIDTYADKMNFQYAGISNITGDGTLVILTFKVKDNAEDGTTVISIVPEEGTFFKYDGMNEVDIDVLFVDGVIEIVNYVKGDINGDGRVNNRDAARLLQYLAGWGVDCVDAALDINGDGRVNNRDAARLMQYLAGWSVEIY